MLDTAEPLLPLIQDRFPVLVGTFLTGVVLLMFGSYVLARHRRWRAHSAMVTGQVIRLETDRPGDVIAEGADGNPQKSARRVWPVYRYSDTTGTTHERRSPSGFKGSSLAVGDELELFVPPDRPYAARTDDGSEFRVAVGALVLAGACLVAVAVGVLL